MVAQQGVQGSRANKLPSEQIDHHHRSKIQCGVSRSARQGQQEWWLVRTAIARAGV